MPLTKAKGSVWNSYDNHKSVNVMDAPYNAPVDGSDATVQIQAALDSGATHIEFGPYTFEVSKLRVPNGVRKISGNGATLRCNSYVGEALIELDGSFFSTTPTSDCEIHGFIADLYLNHRRFVFLGGANQRCKIHHNTVRNFRTTSGSMEGIRIYHDCAYNDIHDNNITLPIDEPFGTYPVAIGIYLTGNAHDIYGGLSTGVYVAPTNVPNRNQIFDNTVFGGTHGIHLYAARYNLITNNILQSQSHRSIILSPQGSYNSITNNHCLSFGSAAVHLNHQSVENTIEGNYCRASTVYTGLTGENIIGIQTYCQDNTVVNNHLSANGAIRYGIYIGPMASNNFVNGNKIDASDLTLAAICMENEFDGTLPGLAIYSRPNYSAPPDGGAEWAYQDTVYNQISNNEILNPAATIGAIVLTQLTAGTAYRLRYNTVQGNTIVGSEPAHFLYFYEETAGNLDGNILKDNSWRSTNFAKIYLNNGRSHFNAVDGNVPMNNHYDVNPFMNATDGDTTPDVSQSDHISFANYTAATNVTMFDGGMDGQELIVRMHPNVTIIHNTSLIRAKGGVNITGATSNDIVVFKRISGIWFEKSRSF